MNPVFRAIIVLGVPFGLYVTLAWDAEWVLSQPVGPVVFLAFWALLWLQPLWIGSRKIDSETYSGFLSMLAPIAALMGVLLGLVGCVLSATGHPAAGLVSSPQVAGVAVLLGVATLAIPGVFGGYTKPLKNEGPIHDPRGMIGSHPPPVTTAPLQGASDSATQAQD